MKIVLLGAPGSGKGTHAEYLQKKFNIPHISTGEIFRDAIKKETELGLLAKSFIDYGNLVPDEVTIDLVKQRLLEQDCKNGFILDGFPRTLNQAKALNDFIKIDLTLYFNIELELALKRLLNRRVCGSCGYIYNLLNYNKKTCQICGGELIVRKDDNEETIIKRFNIYNEVTFPLIKFYEKLNVLKTINVEDMTVEENRKLIEQVLGEVNE